MALPDLVFFLLNLGHFGSGPARFGVFISIWDTLAVALPDLVFFAQLGHFGPCVLLCSGPQPHSKLKQRYSCTLCTYSGNSLR